MKRIAMAIGVTAMIGVAVTAVATAGAGGSRQGLGYQLSQERPASSTAEHFVVDYKNPDEGEAKPPAVRKVVTILPKGTRYDTGVPASCTASDAELTAAGVAACPAASAVGGGVVTVDTGVPGPSRFVTADVEFLNNATDPDGEFVYLNTVRGSDTRTVIRADLGRRIRVTEAGMLPGTPPDGGAIDTVDVTVDAVSALIAGERRSYITTPRRCPVRGYWLMRTRFSYGDGVTQTRRDHTPCHR